MYAYNCQQLAADAGAVRNQQTDVARLHSAGAEPRGTRLASCPLAILCQAVPRARRRAPGRVSFPECSPGRLGGSSPALPGNAFIVSFHKLRSGWRVLPTVLPRPPSGRSRNTDGRTRDPWISRGFPLSAQSRNGVGTPQRDCKSAIPGSNPGGASFSCSRRQTAKARAAGRQQHCFTPFLA